MRFFSLSTAALLFFTHQINKAIQHSRVAVQDITTTDDFVVIVGNGLSPFFVASGVAPIPVLKLDGVSQNHSHTLHAIGLDHTLCRIVAEIHSVEVFPHRRFNGLLALEIYIVGGSVLLQLPMFFCIGGRMGIDLRCLQFFLQDRYLYDYTFSNDNGQNPLMDKAHAYVENWKEAYKSNIGLLLFGDVGTGKSFFAGCIANALLDQDVPVLMTNFPTILNRLTGMFSEDRSEFIASFDEYDLLIIDDLGVERSTEYAMEQMFFVIDSRYRSRRPMIITTNLKLSELKNPPDLAHARIYDRILERCAPILFDGKNFREENAGATRQAAKDIVNSKHD